MNIYTFVVFYGSSDSSAHRDIKAASYEAAEHDLLLLYPGITDFTLVSTNEASKVEPLSECNECGAEVDPGEEDEHCIYCDVCGVHYTEEDPCKFH
jgi:hypothetical protein